MRIFYLMLVLAVCLFPVTQAQAQTQTKQDQDQKVQELKEVTVVGKAENQSLTVPNIETAIRRIGTTPGGVDIIDANDYERGRATTMQDVLGYSPGVYVQPRFGAEESRLSIRGSGIQRTFHLRGVMLLQDGVPINQADGGGDFQAIEPLAQQYIEVYRGANALEYGSTTLGGAVNFVSNTGYNASPLQGRFELGSFDFLRSQASSGMTLGPLDYYVSGTTMNLTGFRDHSDQDNRRIFTNGGYRLNENVETRFYVTVLDSKSKLPGNLTKTQMNTRPEQANPTNVRLNQKRDFDLVRVANRTVFRWTDIRFEVASWWFRKDLFHPIFQVLDVVSNDWGADLKFVSEKPVFDFKNIFIFGVLPQFGVIDDQRYVNLGGRSGSMTASAKQFAMNLNIYAEEQFYILPKLAIVGGLQGVIALRNNDDKFLFDGDNSADPQYGNVNPKAGFRYEVTPESQIFANISRSFEPPSFGELTNFRGGGLVSLKAQSAWTLEAGSRGNQGPFSWDIAWYYAWVDDELLSLNDGIGNPLGTVNAQATSHQGVEFGTRTTVFEGILKRKPKKKSKDKGPEAVHEKQQFLGINVEEVQFEQDRIIIHGIYNWSRFKFDEDPVYAHNYLPGIPEDFLRAELLYEHPWGFYVGPNLEWSFKRYPVDMANTLFADSYAIMGIKGGLRLPKGFSFFVEGRNLTDKIYAATTGVIADARGRDSAQFLPGDGRSVFAGVEWRF